MHMLTGMSTSPSPLGYLGRPRMDEPRYCAPPSVPQCSTKSPRGRISTPVLVDAVDNKGAVDVVDNKDAVAVAEKSMPGLIIVRELGRTKTECWIFNHVSI